MENEQLCAFGIRDQKQQRGAYELSCLWQDRGCQPLPIQHRFDRLTTEKPKSWTEWIHNPKIDKFGNWGFCRPKKAESPPYHMESKPPILKQGFCRPLWHSKVLCMQLYIPTWTVSINPRSICFLINISIPTTCFLNDSTVESSPPYVVHSILFIRYWVFFKASRITPLELQYGAIVSVGVFGSARKCDALVNLIPYHQVCLPSSNLAAWNFRSPKELLRRRPLLPGRSSYLYFVSFVISLCLCFKGHGIGIFVHVDSVHAPNR